MQETGSEGSDQVAGGIPAEPFLQAGEPQPELHPFTFTGTAKAFFAIWIVNLFLTIITIGIYSAWAKVRKKRYFYGNTWVAESNFEYHGNPVAILKGRLIALVAFVAYSALGRFQPKLAAMLALVLFAFAPWFIARSMAFNAWNSSYRNIRFHFRGTYKDVLRAIWPIGLFFVFALFAPNWDPETDRQPPATFWLVFALQLLTFALSYPYVVGALKRLHVNQSRYGSATFAIDIGVGAFYKTYLVAYVVIFVTGVVAGGIAAPIAIYLSVLAPFMFVVVYFAIFSVSLAFTRARIGNLVFNNTRLEGKISFDSNLRTRKLAKLYFGNFFAILFSLGLAIPWAVIRVMRYRAECLSLRTSSSFSELVSSMGSQVGATGEELGEFFNIDLSL